MAIKTGIAILTELVKHACRVLATYRDKIDAVIDAAVTAGDITAAQATTIKDWLDLADSACSILRLVSGY